MVSRFSAVWRVCLLNLPHAFIFEYCFCWIWVFGWHVYICFCFPAFSFSILYSLFHTLGLHCFWWEVSCCHYSSTYVICCFLFLHLFSLLSFKNLWWVYMLHLLILPVLLIRLGLCWSSWVYRLCFSSNLINSSINFFALSLSHVLLGLWWLWIYTHCTPYVDPQVFKIAHSFLFSFSDCMISLIYLQVHLFFFLSSWVCCWTVYWVIHFNYNTLQLQNF